MLRGKGNQKNKVSLASSDRWTRMNRLFSTPREEKDNGESKEVGSGGSCRGCSVVFTRVSPRRPRVWSLRGYTNSTARLPPSSTA